MSGILDEVVRLYRSLLHERIGELGARASSGFSIGRFEQQLKDLRKSDS